MTCNKCKKQYTGETIDHFRGRRNNCRSKSRSFDRETVYAKTFVQTF